eukprot:Rhum_TRINITY_DN8025_c0_g1::Rhum_TRINITY_DN8025_c0_g1_i1::g.25845::m.25845
MPPKLVPISFNAVKEVTAVLKEGDIVTVTHRHNSHTQQYRTDWGVVQRRTRDSRVMVLYEGDEDAGELELPMRGATGLYLRVVRGRHLEPFLGPGHVPSGLAQVPAQPLPAPASTSSGSENAANNAEPASDAQSVPSGEPQDDESLSDFEEAQGPTVAELLPAASRTRYNRNWEHFAAFCAKKKWEAPVTANQVVHYFRDHAIGENDDPRSGKWMYTTCWSKHSGIRRVVETQQEVYDVATVHQFLKHIEEVQITRRITPTKARVFCKKDLFGFLQTDYSDSQIKKHGRGSHLFWMVRQAIASVAFFTGCRGGELQSMRAGGVKLDPRYGYWVEYEQMKLRGAARAERTKSALVPFGVAFNCLKVYLETLAKNQLDGDDWRSAPLWRSVASTGTTFCKDVPMGRNVLPKVPQEIATEIGYPSPHRYTGHAWRRSAATWAATRGCSVHQVMKWFGWTSQKTAQGYIDATETLLVEKARMIGGDVGDAGDAASPDPPKKRRVDAGPTAAATPQVEAAGPGITFGDVGAGAVITITTGAPPPPPAHRHYQPNWTPPAARNLNVNPYTGIPF